MNLHPTPTAAVLTIIGAVVAGFGLAVADVAVTAVRRRRRACPVATRPAEPPTTQPQPEPAPVDPRTALGLIPVQRTQPLPHRPAPGAPAAPGPRHRADDAHTASISAAAVRDALEAQARR